MLFIGLCIGREKFESLRALEGIDEVMQVFSANSASISLLNANSNSLLIEVQRGLLKKMGLNYPLG